VIIDAYHLPGIAHPPTSPWTNREGTEPIELRIPRLTTDDIGVQAEALLDARERVLATRPVAEIVAVIDRVAARLLDRGDELRRGADEALPAITGASSPMTALVLDRMAADWRAPALLGLLRAEFGDPAALDGFVARGDGSGRARAYGPPLATHIFSGNIPGIAVTSMIRSLLVKSAVLGKTAAGDQVLPVLFARGVADADPALGECLAVAYWPGDDQALTAAALERAGAVVVYGGQEAVASVRDHAPAGARFIAYGHRVSFGLVAREALNASAAPALAAAAALDVATFDQQGCVSPHLFFAEEGGEVSPVEWAAMIASEMASLESELPRGALSAGETAAIHQLRGEAELAGIAGAGVILHASVPGTSWTVIVDPEPGFEPSCLNRVVRIKPVAGLAEGIARAEPVARFLQTVGIAAPPDRASALADQLGALGASRICPIGEMSWPPPTWHHDGHPPLLEMVRWCDWE
jgi:hypothetical protein